MLLIVDDPGARLGPGGEAEVLPVVGDEAAQHNGAARLEVLLRHLLPHVVHRHQGGNLQYVIFSIAS